MSVSPATTIDHGTIARWLGDLLERTCPADHYVVGLGQAIVIDGEHEPRPDVVVAHTSAYLTAPVPAAELVLVAEVVSPCSSLHDTHVKRGLYARAGVPSYWVVVPQADSPALAVAELVLDDWSGQYIYRTPYTSDAFTTERPWPVTVDVPAVVRRRAKLFRSAGRTP